MLIFGGLPWQAYFQRVLSANSANNARIQSVCAGLACMFMAIPSIFIGAAAKATDWDTIFAIEANKTGRPPMKILVSKLFRLYQNYPGRDSAQSGFSRPFIR